MLMAAPTVTSVSCELSEEQLLCSICLEVFTDPVTTPCGHNFCKHCIEQHMSRRVLCPVCNERFSTRPQVKTNTVVAEMVTQFKNKRKAAGLKHRALEGDVPCDLCPEPRVKALKSCLLCLASFCLEHLQPHVSNPRLKRHQLIQASPDLEERVCQQHDAPLQMFCRTDSKLICLQCFSDQHQTHQVVPLAVQCQANQEQLKEVIQKRRQEIQEIQSLVAQSLRNANKEIQDGIEVFNALRECVQRSQDTFKQEIMSKHVKTQTEAGIEIVKIRKEIEELEGKSAEMAKSEDHFQVLQRFSSMKHRENVQVKAKRCVQYRRVLVNSVAKLLYGEFSRESRKVFKTRLRRLKQDKVDVFPSRIDVEDSMHNLRISEESLRCIMGSQTFSSGQFYFEVEVKDKLRWAVGVVNASALQRWSPFYDRSKMWLMIWDGGKYHPATVRDYTASVKSIPRKIGVFVNYDKCFIAFYDAITAVRIGSTKNCGFTGEICPMFCLKHEPVKEWLPYRRSPCDMLKTLKALSKQ